MKNLAGVEACDQTIREELRLAGITAVEVSKSKGEVEASVVGKMAPFVFHRAWYYWIVTGPVPLQIAKELYAGIGKTDVRVAGHCGCPPPETPWITYYAPTGKTWADMKDKKELSGFVERGTLPKEVLLEHEFSEKPEDVKAEPFITCYHIDSQEGLDLFAKTVKAHLPQILAVAASCNCLDIVAREDC